MNLQLKRRRLGAYCFGTVFIFSMIIYSCDDFGLEADYFARVEGELNINGVPPEATDELLLALVKGLSGGLSLKSTTTIARRELNPNSLTQEVKFVMETEADTLDALFVVWKERGKPLSIIENIVGSYCSDSSLNAIELADNDTVVSDIAIDVNLKKVNRVAGMSGIIEFQGAWPADIDKLGIVFADSILISSIIESFFSEGKIVIDVCTLLQHSDIRFIEERNIDTLRVDFKVAPGPTLMVVAMSKKGESIFDPVILTKTDLPNLIASTFNATKDSTISGLRSVAQF